MFKNLTDRRQIIQLAFSLFFLLLIIRLAMITIVDGDVYREKAENNRMKKIPEIAKRGEIYDRNGKLLAGNIPAFTVQLMASNLDKEEMNDVSLKVMNILESHKEVHILFPIQKNQSGFYYVFDNDRETFLLDKGFSPMDTARTVFDSYREKEHIADELNDTEAYEFLMKKGIILPISAKKMKFWSDVEKEKFLALYGIDDVLSAEEAYRRIRDIKSFAISKSLSDEDAIKILTLRHALKQKGYMKYDPIKIAGNISKETAIILKEVSMGLPGVDVVVEPIRQYPYNNSASHILGYMGKISSEYEINKFVTENGYNENQLIGKVGIEGNYELDLKGDNGYKFIEVDAYGKLVKEIKTLDGQNTVPSKSGKDVRLTIDIDLQQKLEAHLKDALQAIQVGGMYKSPWGNYKYNESFPNAKTGAAVVLDVKTGEVLAMASYPDYDLNLFSTGIDYEDWKNLSPENPRDPLSPRPLYNTAAMSAVQPGSTYKMITGYAAMEKGMNPYRLVRDNGFVELGSHKYGCWIWNKSHATHGLVNLIRALEVSCNYYFFDVSSGYDYASQTSLGYSLSTQELLDSSKQFGLGEDTGLEIEESSGGLPEPDKKRRSILYGLKSKLKQNSIDYFTQEISGNEDKLNALINEIVTWADANPSRGQVINQLKELKAVNPNYSVDRLADTIKFDYFNMLKWSEGDKLNLAIGQGDHRYTPVQMARFIAAIANGGYLHPLTIIDKVADQEPQRQLSTETFDKEGNLKYIREGMLNVTIGSSGTAKSIFSHFPVRVGGKTGTAQNQGKIPPKDEKAYLQRHLKSINSKLSWPVVEAKSKEILKKRSNEIAQLQLQAKKMDEGAEKDKLEKKINYYFAQGYLTEESGLRSAIIELSNRKVSDVNINQFMPEYDNYSWFTGFAPYDDPQIAVVVMIPQGGHGGYSAPVARDIIADYMHLDPANYNLSNIVQSGATQD